MKFHKLFEPISIGTVNIKNRIAMAAMAPVGLVDHKGGFSQRAIDYYAERAFGGVGLIITGVNKVTELEPLSGYLSINWDSFPSFSELAEIVHYHGSRLFAQLTPGYGRNLSPRLIDSGHRPVSPSALPSYWRPNVTTRPLTIEEIGQIVAAFGTAAELLRAAGIDGIEVQGYGGYLLDEFTTARWNNRKDKYGGNLRDRLRLPVELVNAIKDKAGKDFPVIYKYSVKHYIKGPSSPALGHEDYVEAGRDIGEGLKMAQLLERAGFDALDLGAGCYDSWYWAYPPTYQPHGVLVDLAWEVKKSVSIPVIVLGRMDVPAVAERVLKEQKADMVALGRGLLADPHWPKKIREAKVEEIRPCIGCHDGCLQRIMERKPLSCGVNPSAGKEKLHNLKLVQNPKKVLIVGGGIAGMEAARASALKGNEVILYEKSGRLGGHLIAASVPEFKQDLRKLLEWYKNQLRILGVKIEYQTEANPELVRQEKPDRVIVATGSRPVIPNMPGIKKPIVTICTDLLLGKKRAGETIIVIGGGLVGCETALWLATQGKRVTIVDALPVIPTGNMFYSNKAMLFDLLKENKVEFVTNAKLHRVEDKGVSIIQRDFNTKTLSCETAVLAVGLESNKDLYLALREHIVDIHVIGDCKEPRKILNAIWEGYHIA